VTPNAVDLRKIRNSNIEIALFQTNPNDQNTNDQNKKKFKASYNAVLVLNFENLNFGFVSNFGFRDSNL